MSYAYVLHMHTTQTKNGIRHTRSVASPRGKRRPELVLAGAGGRPVQPPGKMSQVAGVLPGMGEVAERGGEDPTGALGEAPREGIARFATRSRRPRDALRVFLGLEPVRSGGEQDACVGTEISEEVELVVPQQGRSEMGHRGMGRLEHVNGERTGPRMAGEPAAHPQPRVLTAVAGVA